MMGYQSIFSTILFIFFLSVSGLIGFPFVFSIFKSLPDRGYAFSKLATLLMLSYISWLLSHTGPFFTNTGILVVFVLVTACSSFIFYKKGREIKKFISEKKGLLIFEETLFLVFFFVFLAIRIGNPDLWHPVMGGEKPMDFAFINALFRTNSLPPYDPWLSGHIINYYYFGQFLVALLAKLLLTQTSIIYNLFLAFLFGQTAVAAASIVFSFTKSRLFSLVGSVLLVVCGNLAQLPVVIDSFKNLIPINGWYWTASRVMPNHEINEFPFFTFIYADLHSHLVSLPITLLAVALTIQIYHSLNNDKIKNSIILIIFISFTLGIIRITNIWDYPTYLLLALLPTFILPFFIEKTIIKKFLYSFVLPISILILSHISILPFLLHYKTGPLGLALYEGPYTLIQDYLKIHGLFLSISLVFFALIIRPKKLLEIRRILGLLIYIPFAFAVVFSIQNLYFLAFLSTLIFIGTIAFATTGRKYIIPIFLFVFAVFLTMIPDIIDIKLGLGRMNTVFKFYFQAWSFFALSSALFIYFIFEKIKKTTYPKFILGALFFVLFSTTLLYPFTASPAKIVDRMGTDKTLTLNGMNYMNTSVYSDQGQILQLKDDLAAMEWINSNILINSVIVEANTPIYRWGGRVSIYTGLPTVLGWDWHEIAHRQYLPAQDIQIRQNHVKQIYESADFTTTKDLLLLYNVSYIYLGQLEKAYYDTNGIGDVINNNPNYFEKIYSNSNVTIYKLLNGKYY